MSALSKVFCAHLLLTFALGKMKGENALSPSSKVSSSNKGKVTAFQLSTRDTLTVFCNLHDTWIQAPCLPAENSREHDACSASQG